MAKTKRTARKAHPLYLDGAGKVPGITYGVLRAAFNDRPNSSVTYVACKLHVADLTATVWCPAVRYDVVTPATAPSAWWRPRDLWTAFEAARLPYQRDLALTFTCYIQPPTPIQVGWEQVRSWAASALVADRSLAVTLVLHVPALAGSPNDPHVHIIASARTLHGDMFGGFAAETNDEGMKQLALHLAAHRAKWPAVTP